MRHFRKGLLLLSALSISSSGFAQRGEGDGKFSMVIFPDYQEEAIDKMGGEVMAARTKFIVEQRDARDIRFVATVGDNVDYGGNPTSPSPEQFERVSTTFKTLDDAKLPYLIGVGNHDGAAVARGGSAADEKNTKTLLRDTQLLNSKFPQNRIGYEGSWQPGVLDNSYKIFTAEGYKWLVLTIEMYPRQGALDWAKQVVESHPDSNVIVINHYLANDDMSVPTGPTYGDLNADAIYQQLILKYPNIRLAFSGHTGLAGTRVDTGVNGNKVATMMQTFHSKESNPMRFVEIDVQAGTVNTTVEASALRASVLRKNPDAKLPDYSAYKAQFSDMNFVKPQK